jgi:hypothetical protein
MKNTLSAALKAAAVAAAALAAAGGALAQETKVAIAISG